MKKLSWRQLASSMVVIILFGDYVVVGDNNKTYVDTMDFSCQISL